GHRILECEAAGHLERELVRVDVVVGAVEYGHAEVDHRVTRKIAAHARFLDALLDCGNVLPRNRAAEDVVDELEVGAAGKRVDLDLAVAELPMAAGLLLVAAV